MVYLRFVVTWIFKLLMWGGIASFLWLTYSCEEFCEEPNRTAVVINFYDATNASLSINVKIKGIENDSVLYPNADFGTGAFSQVLLPVNPTADVMSFSIQNGDAPADIIIIHYTRHNGFISSVCGCVTYAEIQGEPEIRGDPEKTERTITHLEVVNPNVTTVSYRQGVKNNENIRIYY